MMWLKYRCYRVNRSRNAILVSNAIMPSKVTRQDYEAGHVVNSDSEFDLSVLSGKSVVITGGKATSLSTWLHLLI